MPAPAPVAGIAREAGRRIHLVRLILWSLGVLLACLAALAFWLLGGYEKPAVDPGWAVAGSASVPAGAVTVRWTGTSTLLFSDGETAWMVDGWFTRPGPIRLAVGRIGPDPTAIRRGLERNGLGAHSSSRLAAVIPVHSHYDHAMDAPEVARQTGALLVGSESTANIGRGWGLDEAQIRVVRDREALQLGRFRITMIESRHFRFPDPVLAERALANPEITQPLVPPVGPFEYRLGKAYAIHVDHPLGRWLIQGSAGYVEGALDGFESEVVFLGISGLGSQTAAYQEAYWDETVTRVGAQRVIPIHWDSLTGPIEGPFEGPVRAAVFLAGRSEDTLAFLKRKEAESPSLRFSTLPRYDEVVLFSPTSDRSTGRLEMP
jgi:L-ascorbate metabolism protein UlaG (beta-lactamase superfamily)